MQPPLEEYNQPAKTGHYIVAIVVNSALLYVFNNLLSWNLPYLTQDFAKVLPILNLSLYVKIASNFLFMFIDSEIFRQFIRIIFDCFGLAVVYTMLTVFPLDLSSLSQGDTISSALQIAFTASIFAIALAILVKIIRLVLKVLSS